MNDIDVYNAIRSEIAQNHALMHWFSIIITVILLAGVAVIENRQTILSIFLPLLSVSWASAMVRFDFFIHRQGAYLRVVEARLQGQAVSIPLWESWKMSLRSTQFVVPVADALACAVIVIPTIYLLFGPTQEFFRLRQWRGRRIYAWAVSAILILLLCFLAVIPKIVE